MRTGGAAGFAAQRDSSSAVRRRTSSSTAPSIAKPMQTQAMGWGARTGTTTNWKGRSSRVTMAEASPWEPAARDEGGDGKRAADEAPAEGVGVDRAVERDQEDGVAVDARAEVREGGGDGGPVGRGDRLPKREVGGQHAQRRR